MRSQQDTRPLSRTLIWIAIYIVVVNIGDSVGEVIDFPGLTSIMLVALSVMLLIYLRAGQRRTFYGVRPVQPGTLPLTLYYVPLFAVALLQFGTGFRTSLDFRTIFFAVLLVAAVAFIEELLFRGFLLQTLRMRGKLTRAIIISGVTFGIGHIVNLLRGYSLTEQALQIVAAVIIGIALAYCVVLTGSIMPGIAFHLLFNLGGTLTLHSVLGDTVTVGVIALLTIPYILFLRHRLNKTGPGVTMLANPHDVTASRG